MKKVLYFVNNFPEIIRSNLFRQSEDIRRVGNVPETFTDYKIKNGWLKYDHRLMYKKYTTPLANCGMWGSLKTSLDGPVNKNNREYIIAVN